MTQAESKQRPEWATRIAYGFAIAAFGLLILGVGALISPAFTGVGVLIICVGAAMSLMGGASYFMKMRQ